AALGEPVEETLCDRVGIVSLMKDNGEFRAMHEPFTLDAKSRVCLPREAHETLRGTVGVQVGVTPTDGLGPVNRAAARIEKALRGKRDGKPKRKSMAKKPSAKRPRK
ncbi:MAG: hypothetical protein K8E66_03030, partial [Phycisphaerales bacterium]|nr:hypothetical protein [Phycisphaerales bacterium]